MSAESEEFKELRRLLTIKRYEQPPPGYFNSFSRQVIARIEAGERGNDYSPFGWLGQSWVARLWGSFGTKPILAGAFGVTICSVLIAGVAFSDRNDASSLPSVATSARDQSGFAMSQSPVTGLLQPVAAAPQQASSVTTVPQQTSLFQEIAQPRAQLIMDVVPPSGRN
jgi:hypothetical protein